MLNVITVFKSGGEWREEYVYRMRDMLLNNLSEEFRFICLSDVPLEVETIDLLPISENVPGYWNKIQLFRPGLFNGPCLFIDLDTIIKGPINKITDQLSGSDFLMVRSPFRAGHHSSCFMYWEGDHSYLWDLYRSKPPSVWDKQYKQHMPFESYGDQAFISDNVSSYGIIQDVTEHAGSISRIKKRESKDSDWLLICSGKRRPWDLLSHPDVCNHWL
jgi:hypothetical protein